MNEWMKIVEAQFNEIMQTIQDTNLEINKELESPKESQTKIRLKKKFRKLNKSSEESLTNWLFQARERISGLEGKVDKTDHSRCYRKR